MSAEAQRSGTPVVLIGKKSPVNYVLAIIDAFTNAEAQEVVVKARGRAVCKAVDVINTVKSRYFKDIYVKSFDARYEDIEEEKGKARVAAVEIVIARGQVLQQTQASSSSSPSGS